MELSSLDRVVVPIDLAEPAVEALRTATELAGSVTKVHVLTVLPELHPMDPAVSPDLTDDVRAERTAAALARVVDDLGFGGANLIVRVGEPAHVVARTAAAIDADLIVVASHGYTGVQRLLLGSVAERIVRLAACPVLVLKRGAA